MVSFQTNLKWGEQESLPNDTALRNAEFVRKGMHRNLFVCAPTVLTNTSDPHKEDIFLAGQITIVEGYLESTAMGLLRTIRDSATQDLPMRISA